MTEFFYTLHFNGRIGRHADEAAAAASLQSLNGIILGKRRSFEGGVGGLKMPALVELYNQLLGQAKTESLAVPSRLANPVKKFENREIAIDRLYRLAMAVAAGQVVDDANELALQAAYEAELAQRAAAMHPVEPPVQDPPENATEAADSAAKANPSMFGVDSVSEHPENPATAEVVLSSSGDPGDEMRSPAPTPLLPTLHFNDTALVIDSGSGMTNQPASPASAPMSESEAPSIAIVEATGDFTQPVTPGGAESAIAPVTSVAARRKTMAGAKEAAHVRPRLKRIAGAGKGDTILALMRRPGGATLAELVNASGWQPHSIRGYISTAGKKQRIDSAKNAAGERVYSIA